MELPELNKIDEVSLRIGKLIADEVEDGSTLQLGWGNVPSAVGRALADKRDLGIHTELFTDGMLDLIECGAVNNSRKNIDRYKNIMAFALGSRKLYDFMDDNQSVEIRSVDYVNDPSVIARNDKVISVNAGLEIDFLGQVSAETLGGRPYSSTGGQVDFVRGAQMSPGGRSFITMPSTAQKGELSRINPVLARGSVVTTSKNDVDCVVTEYGMARLKGKTWSQRAKALIAVAHPKFREALLFEGRKMNVII
jgi:acyl-CoA hydrolase